MLPVSPNEGERDLDKQFHVQHNPDANCFGGRDGTLHQFLPDLHAKHRDLFDHGPSAQLHEVLSSVLLEEHLRDRSSGLVFPHSDLHAGDLQPETRLHEIN